MFDSFRIEVKDLIRFIGVMSVIIVISLFFLAFICLSVYTGEITYLEASDRIAPMLYPLPAIAVLIFSIKI